MPLSKDIEAVIHAKEANRKDRDWNNHHTVLAEGVPAVGWVAVVRSSLIPLVYYDDRCYAVFRILSLVPMLKISRNRPNFTETGSSRTTKRSMRI